MLTRSASLPCISRFTSVAFVLSPHRRRWSSQTHNWPGRVFHFFDSSADLLSIECLIAGDDASLCVDQDGAAGAELLQGFGERSLSALSSAVRVMAVELEAADFHVRFLRMNLIGMLDA